MKKLLCTILLIAAHHLHAMDRSGLSSVVMFRTNAQGERVAIGHLPASMSFNTARQMAVPPEPLDVNENESSQHMSEEEQERCHALARNIYQREQLKFQDSFNTARQLISWNPGTLRQWEQANNDVTKAPSVPVQETPTLTTRTIAYVQSWINYFSSNQ